MSVSIKVRSIDVQELKEINFTTSYTARRNNKFLYPSFQTSLHIKIGPSLNSLKLNSYH